MFEYNENGKIFPKIDESVKKSGIIKGIETKVISQSQNTLVVELPQLDYVGDFDIILYDEIDYDTFYNAEGFYLKATK